MKRWVIAGVLLTVLQGAWAEEAKLPEVDLHGDEAAMKRGAETVFNVCMGCHSLKYIKYRDLLKSGFTKEDVDTLRGQKGMDNVLISMLDMEAAKQTFGVAPPDLSLMAKARAGGARYVYAYLTGFYNAEHGTDNHIFPGVRMPDVLGISMASPAERVEIENKAKDIAIFLEWAADPGAQTRRSLGYYVIGYLVLLTVLFKLLKIRIWKRLPPMD